jgi:hypothetical protein
MGKLLRSDATAAQEWKFHTWMPPLDPGPSGTAELQLGIHQAITFSTTLERNWRHAEREYIRRRGICTPTGRNAELELGGPRIGHPRGMDAADHDLIPESFTVTL